MSENELSPIGLENGPKQEQIDGWKEKFGDVYVASFAGGEKIIYRPMKRFEYKQILNLGQSPENRAFVEEKIAQQCVLWPEMDAKILPTLKAGTISTLVDLIMAASNFGISEEPIKL